MLSTHTWRYYIPPTILASDNDVTNHVHGIQSSAEILLLLLEGHAVDDTYGDIYTIRCRTHGVARCDLSRYSAVKEHPASRGLASTSSVAYTISLTPDPLSWLRVGCLGAERIDHPKSRCSRSRMIPFAACWMDEGPGTADGHPLHGQKFPGTHFQKANEEPRFLFRYVYTVCLPCIINITF